MKDVRVTGVIAEDKSGKTIEIESGAVVIATGGFASNKEMVKKYTGFELGKDLFTLFNLGLDGDGINMAWEAEADRDSMGMQVIFGCPGPQLPSTQISLAQAQPLSLD